jgi:hypothetical protein
MAALDTHGRDPTGYDRGTLWEVFLSRGIDLTRWGFLAEIALDDVFASMTQVEEPESRTQVEEPEMADPIHCDTPLVNPKEASTVKNGHGSLASHETLDLQESLQPQIPQGTLPEATLSSQLPQPPRVMSTIDTLHMDIRAHRDLNIPIFEKSICILFEWRPKIILVQS